MDIPTTSAKYLDKHWQSLQSQSPPFRAAQVAPPPDDDEAEHLRRFAALCLRFFGSAETQGI